MQAFENKYCLFSFYCCKNDTLNCRNLCLHYPRKKVLCANTVCDDCINLISKKLDAVDSAPETHSGSTTLITSASEPKNNEGGDVSYDDDAATETVDASSRPMSRGRQTLMISRSRYSAGRPSKRTVRCK